MINAYAPTSCAEDEKVEQFYDIERAMADSDSEYKIITGVSMQKLELKQKKKTSRVWEHLK